MAEQGQFNTDASALKSRIDAHNKFGLNDINEWVFNLLKIKKRQFILDIGCGTGKQTIPIAKVVGHSGKVFALDISPQALEILKEQAAQLNLSKQITIYQGDLDKIKDFVGEKTFDRVLSCYSFYYTTNSEYVFDTIHNCLKNDGIFFFCGPAKDNNLELRKFHFKIKDGRQHPPEADAALFMEETGLKLAKKFFGSFELHKFENPLEFDSPESLHSYWSSYNLYEKELDTKFMNMASRHFKSNNFFTTVKRVIGIKVIK